MDVELAGWIVRLVGIYLLAGVLVALPFVARGAGRIDPVAREGSLGFRILIFPGAVALWPICLIRWLGAAGAPREERNPHRRAARRPSGGQA